MDDPEAERFEQEALRLLRDMARLWERMRFYQPWDRSETEEEAQEIDRLYVELGKLTAAVLSHRVGEFGRLK
jgi:hypothetical protein